jgi:hypothetical protein
MIPFFGHVAKAVLSGAPVLEVMAICSFVNRDFFMVVVSFRMTARFYPTSLMFNESVSWVQVNSLERVQPQLDAQQ